MRLQRALLAAAVVEIAVLLLLPAPPNYDKPGITGGIRTAAAQLRGDGPPIDLVQDYLGARRLVSERDSYPRLGEASKSVGVDLPVKHRSTHPPTAFALVLPVAWLPWKAAAAVWAALMLVAIAASWWALGAAPGVAVALAPLTLLWPPAAWSLGQLTPLWLLGLALAWRLRTRAAAGGAGIAFASLTKLLPTLSLLPLLAVGRWRALRGFAAVWAAALAVLLLLHAGALTRYLHVARSSGREQADRGENSALLWAAGHAFGVVGLVVTAALVAVVVATSLRRLHATRTLDRWSWDAWVWAGVALLPIAWIYSLLPLLPGLVRMLRRGTFLARPLALVTLTVPLFVDPFGLPSRKLALATAWLGLALLVDRPAVGAPEVEPASAPRGTRADYRFEVRER